jgi:hypothetical protein
MPVLFERFHRIAIIFVSKFKCITSLWPIIWSSIFIISLRLRFVIHEKCQECGCDRRNLKSRNCRRRIWTALPLERRCLRNNFVLSFCCFSSLITRHCCRVLSTPLSSFYSRAESRPADANLRYVIFLSTITQIPGQFVTLGHYIKLQHTVALNHCL